MLGKKTGMGVLAVTIHLQMIVIREREALHCKNTWVTLTIFLGCLNCISVTKKCY